MRGLVDKHVLITGGGGGIGRALCQRFAAEGCAVGIIDIDVEGAAETVRCVEAAGARASRQVADIADYAAVARAVTGLERELGSLDVLVNNAGWDKFENFLDSEPMTWDRLIDINLRGPLNLHHTVLPGMVERGQGRVINIASDAGRVGSSMESVYSACKGGVIAFTKTVARELARSGITLNAVCPGPTDTPLLRGFLGEGDAGEKIHKALQRAIPM
ncbi:MAG: SDR family NAD(P)-dependent oxidoreductase, partial [Gammaproteobacteria bacterium]|nr:SDR family NAD(P)-dependent oxidoreductase [Gammaproteobacteria bacterium]